MLVVLVLRRGIVVACISVKVVLLRPAGDPNITEDAEEVADGDRNASKTSGGLPTFVLYDSYWRVEVSEVYEDAASVILEVPVAIGMCGLSSPAREKE